MHHALCGWNISFVKRQFIFRIDADTVTSSMHKACEIRFAYEEVFL
jgi:hypothetical protein